MTSAIPIVDLQEFNLTKAPEDVSDDVQRQLAAQIIDAFSTVGFVGLTNYGIPQDKVKEVTACVFEHQLLNGNVVRHFSRAYVKLVIWIRKTKIAINRYKSKSRSFDLTYNYNVYLQGSSRTLMHIVILDAEISEIHLF